MKNIRHFLKELFGLKINLLSSLTSLPRFLHIHWGVDFLTSISFHYAFLLRNHWAGFSELKTVIPLSRTIFKSANKFAEPVSVQGHTLESTLGASFLRSSFIKMQFRHKTQSVKCKIQWVLTFVCTCEATTMIRTQNVSIIPKASSCLL